MALISMSTSMLVISAWITIPFVISFTLQTFAVFLICLLLDLRKSFAAISLYISLGICGLPVFAGFGAGLGVLLGPTGGYVMSFLLVPIVIYVFLHNKNNSFSRRICALLTSLALCYILGTIWYYLNFAQYSDISLLNTFALCTLPFLVPDLLKIFLALIVFARIERIFK